MDKRRIHHKLGRLRKASIWYFITLLLISAIISVISLRQNNLNAIALRDKVIQVDKDNGDVESALRDLREYVYGHMNTQLSSPGGAYPPIQLKYRYDRLVAEQKKNQPTNDSLATEAQRYCEAKIPVGRSLHRIQCIEDYIMSHGSKQKDTAIPDSLYKFDFIPPVWSPDLAGWSIVVTLVLAITLIARITVEQVLKRRLRQRM